MTRSLRTEEVALLTALLSNFPDVLNKVDLQETRVEDMRDGGMGSILFEREEKSHLGKVLVEAESVDVDGTPLSISINLDKNGKLFELDIWKVNFTALRRYPIPANITFTSVPGGSR